jgi:hypothetical protein
MNPFPVQRAHTLTATPPDRRWLIEDLWGDEAVGIVGGEPKCGKSLLALDMAVAVASGQPCLGRFHVRRTGRVLLYAAEDSLPIVRQRLEGVARHGGLDLADLDIWLITAPAVRLDVPEHRQRLTATVETLKPVLLVLDPFVRLHRIDENASAEVVPLLAFLRDLQRQFHCSVLIVHHARKGAAGVRAGQALRGSSEFHAWADAGIFLRWHRDSLVLSMEHRAHPAIPDLALRLHVDGNDVALVIDENPQPEPELPAVPEPQRILDALGQLAQPVSVRCLREHCRMKTASVCDLLNELKLEGKVVNSPAGWSLAPPPPPFPVSHNP